MGHPGGEARVPPQNEPAWYPIASRGSSVWLRCLSFKGAIRVGASSWATRWRRWAATRPTRSSCTTPKCRGDMPKFSRAMTASCSRPEQFQRHVCQQRTDSRAYAAERGSAADGPHVDDLHGGDDSSSIQLSGRRRHRPSRMRPRWLADRQSDQPGRRKPDPRRCRPAESPWLARARSNLQIMYRTALAVSHTLDIDQLLHRIMELIFEWVEADRGCIMLMDPADRRAVSRKVRRQSQPRDARRNAEAHDQQDDPRLRASSATKACSPATRARTTAGTRRPASSRWASARRSACRCRAATTWSA